APPGSCPSCLDCPPPTPSTPKLWLHLPLFCLLQQTLNTLGEAQRKKDNGVKTKVSDSSEGSPFRRMGIENLRKYPSGFPWELSTLGRREVSIFGTQSACEMK
uniref:Uncharacterized protein n=1 Tax=Panthera tigris altaica TaxID=74533 RepID=A0A8C9KLK2_PANTA